MSHAAALTTLRDQRAPARVAFLVLACAVFSAPAAGPASPDRRTAGDFAVTPGPLKLDDADFWGNPARTRAEITAPFVDGGKEVLLYDAPAVVPIDARRNAPTQALRVATFKTLRERPFDNTAVIIVTDLVNNITSAALAIAPSTRESEPPAPPSSVPMLSGIGTETFTIDLRSRLSLPWESGRYVARLVLGDQVSAGRMIELKATSSVVDPEVEKYKAETRSRTAVPTLAPPPVEPFVSYRRDDKSPPLPEGLGINWQLPRVCALDTGAACLLRGTFRLPVLKRHIVPPGPARPGTEALFAQLAGGVKSAPLPTAVVPITLVGTGSQVAVPAVWRLVVPVYDALDFSANQPRGVGTFTVDMRKLQAFDGIEQTWFLYAFSDAVLAGPMTVGLTRRPRTP